MKFIFIIIGIVAFIFVIDIIVIKLDRQNRKELDKYHEERKKNKGKNLIR